MAPSDRVVEGYARAIFAVAEAEGELREVGDELYGVAHAVDDRPELRDTLSNPALPSDRKRSVLEEVLGGKVRGHTLNILSFLVEQGQARDLGRIATSLAELAAGGQGRVLAEVRAAVPLDDDRRERLARALSEVAGAEVELKVLVDPSVIGGVVARVGDQVYDGSIRRKLAQARDQLGRVR